MFPEHVEQSFLDPEYSFGGGLSELYVVLSTFPYILRLRCCLFVCCFLLFVCVLFGLGLFVCCCCCCLFLIVVVVFLLLLFFGGVPLLIFNSKAVSYTHLTLPTKTLV